MPRSCSGDRLDGNAERLINFSQTLTPVIEIAQCRPLQATIGERAQDRNDPFCVVPFCVVPIRQRNIDRQRDGVIWGPPHLTL